jgi:glutathione S-transferase
LLNKFTSSFSEKDNEKKLAIRKDFVEITVPQVGGWAEKLIETNGTGFFAGNALSVADLAWYVFMNWLRSGSMDGIPLELFDQFPKLTALYNTINTNEKVASWNKAHEKKE